MSISTKNLLKRAAQGDREAFGELYEAYLGEIYRYIFFRVYNQQDAEDLTETVFLKTWEGLIQNKPEKIKNLRAWIYRIAHNTVVDYHRTQKTSLPVDALPAPPNPHSASLEAVVSNNIETEQLARHILKLEPHYQQVLILRFINQMSHAETAEVMDISEGNVRVIQYRALKKIRAIIDERD